jgi:hypothetical protein
MKKATTHHIFNEERKVRSAQLLPRLAVEHSRRPGTFSRAKKTLDEGESEWTWILVLVSDYAIAISVFLIMLAAAELAYHFG